MEIKDIRLLNINYWAKKLGREPLAVKAGSTSFAQIYMQWIRWLKICQNMTHHLPVV